MPPKCKRNSNKDRYGPFPLINRFGVDQVPLEMNQRDYTLETKYKYNFKLSQQKARKWEKNLF